MPPDLVALLVLVGVFLVATLRPVNMGAVALVAAFVVGTFVVGESTDELLAGFPGDLFVILVGVTYLFAIAKRNGTVDWLVARAVRLVGGRTALIPWVMFVVCAAVTAAGAASPAAVAIIAPVALGFAHRHRISPMLMGVMVVQGASAGSFSPIGIFGGIVNGVVARNGIAADPTVLFLATFGFNAVLGVLAFLVLGGLRLARGAGSTDLDELGGEAVSASRAATHRPVPPHTLAGSGPTRAAAATATTEPAADTAPRLGREGVATLTGLLGLILGSLVLDLDVGFVTVTVAVLLTLAFPRTSAGAVHEVSWSTVLLIGGIVTYVALLERTGTIDRLGAGVAGIGAPLLAALLICLIGAVVSAFASTTGILGALIPLAVPFLAAGQVSATGLIAALAISSSVVDSSPFSTNGALVVANSAEERRDTVFRGLMTWGMSLVVLAPLVSWALLVLPAA
ncbi:Dicarboxylate carrier protein [Pseudonocardia sp. Ae168_Ps1]|uniref:SLC13 family permease n=1 Tax=unclassified Pseudonocardia TaxID=2619320 RepID=UPI00094B6E47|nr:MULTISPECIES: SLC13 family permease [unclassified Pseudonocardia]OLL73555.1 Dicarboxylate carrier protein [Pseudonocardia sp. Ae150A_Ps1]OLL79526.1 Dicarboxylate carrier protein [Pseudonocardia sp. Ae168_Ps1]OLL86333.1 Dicarboxylate carrier protein [Pseudonocardia sp. Ae263_Ps1]OLL93623.1 Dicarboxylate carrier protein [Pseudonocardia sp. Ae356_Ps1]